MAPPWPGLYRRRRWDPAPHAFRGVWVVAPFGAPSQTLLGRCMPRGRWGFPARPSAWGPRICRLGPASGCRFFFFGVVAGGKTLPHHHTPPTTLKSQPEPKHYDCGGFRFAFYSPFFFFLFVFICLVSPFHALGFFILHTAAHRQETSFFFSPRAKKKADYSLVRPSGA